MFDFDPPLWPTDNSGHVLEEVIEQHSTMAIFR